MFCNRLSRYQMSLILLRGFVDATKDRRRYEAAAGYPSSYGGDELCLGRAEAFIAQGDVSYEIEQALQKAELLIKKKLYKIGA